MCKMRIVILDKEKKVEKDYVAELGRIDINIIDRPSFCIYARNNVNGFDVLIFKYSNLNEENLSAEFGENRILANFGLISGCLYNLAFKSKEYNLKDMSSLYKIVKEKSSSIRFQSNIKSFFDLAKAIIADVSKQSESNKVILKNKCY